MAETKIEVAHCTAESLGIRATKGEPVEIAEVMELIDKYLAGFAQPAEGMKCLKCGTVQTGFLSAAMGTGFQWGIAHGEGACSTCGWPGRGFHKIPDVGTLEMLLQYHPDCVEEKDHDANQS